MLNSNLKGTMFKLWLRGHAWQEKWFRRLLYRRSYFHFTGNVLDYLFWNQMILRSGYCMRRQGQVVTAIFRDNIVGDYFVPDFETIQEHAVRFCQQIHETIIKNGEI